MQTLRQNEDNSRLVKLPNGGTVRIKPKIWQEIQSKAVQMSVALGRPVKESMLIQILLSEALKTADLDSIIEQIENE